MTTERTLVMTGRSSHAYADLEDVLQRELSLEDARNLMEGLEELSHLRDLQGVIDVVGRWARELTNADGVTVVLRDGESVYYAAENAIAPLWKGRRFEAASCISGWVMRNRERAVIPDVHADPRIRLEWYRPTFVKSLAMVPVGTDEPIAAIGIYWAARHTASTRELALLQALANATAVALSNAELLLAVTHGKERFAHLVEALPQLVWTASSDGRAIYFNERWREFTGLSDEQSRDDGWMNAIHTVDAGSVRERWTAAIAAGTTFEAECRVRRRAGGHRWMILRAVPVVEDGRVEEWIGTCTEIEVQKESEQAKLDSIRMRDDFLCVASHELRTPLTALQLQLASAHQLVARHKDGPLDPRLRDCLDRTNRHIERLSSLVDELFDVSRLTGGGLPLVPERFDLVELIHEVADRFRELARSSHSELVVRAEVPKLEGTWDRARLDRVLSNLLSNAIKYGPRKPIDVGAGVFEGRAVVRVRDRGIGIAPEERARIFELFVRAVPLRNYGGLGLGLYVAGQIVKAHGGTIRVESEPGEGATFVVELPIT